MIIFFFRCTTLKKTNDSNVGGEDLYYVIQEFIQNYQDEILKNGQDFMLNDESILKYFTTRWVEYQLSAQILDGLCNYINKHFIKRMISEKRNFSKNNIEVLELYELALVIWKNGTYKKFHHRVIGKEYAFKK